MTDAATGRGNEITESTVPKPDPRAMLYMIKTAWPIAALALAASTGWFFLSRANSHEFQQTYFDSYAAATIATLALSVNLTVVYLTYHVYETALTGVKLAAKATNAAADSAETTKEQLGEQAHYMALEWLPMLDLDFKSIAVKKNDGRQDYGPSFEIDFEVRNKGKGPAFGLQFVSVDIGWKMVDLDVVGIPIAAPLVRVWGEGPFSRPSRLLQAGEKQKYSCLVGLDRCSVSASTKPISRSSWDEMSDSLSVTLERKDSAQGCLPGIDLKFECRALLREATAGVDEQTHTATWRVLFYPDEASKWWRVHSVELVQFRVPVAKGKCDMNMRALDLSGLQSEELLVRELQRTNDWLNHRNESISVSYSISQESKDKLCASMLGDCSELGQYVDASLLPLLTTEQKREFIAGILKSANVDKS